jgi:hypothetical protein
MSQINMIGCYSQDTTLAAQEKSAEEILSNGEILNSVSPNSIRI